MLFFTGLESVKNSFMNSIRSLKKDTPVWRGDDGSYAVGHAEDFNEDLDVEYVEDGVVEDYLDL